MRDLSLLWHFVEEKKGSGYLEKAGFLHLD
jgi:hypothetical protein